MNHVLKSGLSPDSDDIGVAAVATVIVALGGLVSVLMLATLFYQLVSYLAGTSD